MKKLKQFLAVAFWTALYHPLDKISMAFDWMANKVYARLWFAANPLDDNWL